MIVPLDGKLKPRALGAILVLVSLCAGCAGSGLAVKKPTTAPIATNAAVERQILVTVKQARSGPMRSAGSTSRHYVGPSSYKASRRTRRLVEQLARERGLRELDGWPIRVLGVHCVVFDVPEPLSVSDTIASLERDRRVESVQRMQSFSVRGEQWDDPYASMQHGLDTLNVRSVHPWSSGRGVTVAVVDTGVERLHPDLAQSIMIAKDFVDERPGAEVSERHGTAVAGIIASIPGNGIGTVGVAPGSRLIALRACWEPDAAGSTGVCNTFTLAKALAFVIDRRPDVVNLSLSGPADPLLERLTREAMQRGVVIVSAGDEEGGVFPASIAGVVVVRASEGGSDDIARAFLRAPGVDILTTAPGEAFDFVSGSSFAAAHVSGVVALMLERSPKLGVERIRTLLEQTSRNTVDPLGRPVRVIDACAVLSELAEVPVCAPVTGTSVTTASGD